MKTEVQIPKGSGLVKMNSLTIMKYSKRNKNNKNSISLKEKNNYQINY